MSDVLSIEQATQKTPKEKVKDFLGRITAQAMPSRTRQLFRRPAPSSDRLLERAIMFHLRQRAINENRIGFLERVHRAYWSGDRGTEFSSNCDHRFMDLFLVRQREDFESLEATWRGFDGSQIVEIGTNSGLLLNYLTQNLSGVIKSTGIDINQEQVNRNQAESQFDPRIQFICTDGRKWILNQKLSSTLFVTNGGVLEYMPRTRLDELLQHISGVCKPAIFYASEPVAADHDWGRTTESVPFGEEFSFSHNYRDLFESNGFKVVHQRAVDYEEWRMVATVATTGS